MKTKFKITFLIICALFIVGFCNSDDGQTNDREDLINTQYPEAKQEVIETWAAIEQSVREGDMDKLISFHGYSPKFTEYKNGEVVNDGAANEAYERRAYGAVTEVVSFATNDFKVAVYGDVANMTFQSDFQIKFGDNLAVIKEQTTLLFVRTNYGWKIVHEHHSPLNTAD
ncbi:nuclear transport factor 2 family protein [Winogradskyella schleiferi]|uniref:nuclear transport factor 2 family protein n=1 Tax=Winogradskyella schleiferi TaxID=2686078 RepID=UPI0015BE87C6|nr:nuclear transport factor 2 family protein [Winogradskyella schleiferi]